MASIQDITTAASYHGDPSLGGATATSLLIDNTPIQRMGTFAYYAERDKWEQQQKDNIDAANKIAAVTAFDPTSALQPYRADLTDRIAKISDFAKKNGAAALVFKPETADTFYEFQQMKSDFENKRKAATANDVLYQSALTKAQQQPTLDGRDLEMQKVEAKKGNLFAGGIDDAYNKTFEAITAPQPEDSIIPSFDAAKANRSNLLILPNSDVVKTLKYTDPGVAMGLATYKAANMEPETDDNFKNSDAFKRLSPADQAIALQEKQNGSKQRKDIQKQADDVTNILIPYLKEHQDFDVNNSPIENLPSGSSVRELVSWVRGHNKEIRQLNGHIQQGQLKDPTTGSIVTKPFDEVDMKDGFSAAELIYIKGMQALKGPLLTEVDIKDTHTGTAEAKYQVDKTQGGETQRNAATNAKDLKIAQMSADAKAAGKTNPDGSAIDFSNNLLFGVHSPTEDEGKIGLVLTPTDARKNNLPAVSTKISGLSINNGVIVNSYGKPLKYTGDVAVEDRYVPASLVTEYNKYQGSVKLDGQSGAATRTNVNTGLYKDDEGKYHLHFTKGVIDGIQTVAEGSGLPAIAATSSSNKISEVKAKPGTYADLNYIQHITYQQDFKGATKAHPADRSYGDYNNGTQPSEPSPQPAKQAPAAKVVTQILPLPVNGNKPDKESMVVGQKYMVNKVVVMKDENGKIVTVK